MNTILERLGAIDGLVGCAVFDDQNACIAHAAPPAYEAILLVKVMSELQEVFSLYETIEASSALSTFTATFDEGHLVARWVGRHVILAMASPSVNMAMLNVGLNVATVKLTAALSGESATVPSRSGASSPSGTRPSLVPAPANSQESSSTSSRGVFSSLPENQVIPRDAVGISVINAAVKALAKQMGPFAKVEVKEEIKRLGVSAHTIGRSQYEDLLAAVARKIPDQANRTDFLNEARALVR